MAIKGCSILPRSPEIVPRHQMQFRVVARTPISRRGSCSSTRYTVSVFLHPTTAETGWIKLGYPLLKKKIESHDSNKELSQGHNTIYEFQDMEMNYLQVKQPKKPFLSVLFRFSFFLFYFNGNSI